MCVKYKDVLERFVKYREQCSMSQKQLAELLCVSQSYISKMEVGKARISFDILVTLHEYHWDIDFIITGQTNKRTALNDLFDNCKEERKSDFLQYIAWAISQGIKNYDKQMKQVMRYAEKIEYLRLRTTEIAAEESALYGIRTANKLSQLQMAKMLHVDIKKYRAMEKKDKKPDAELLMLLYNNFECMPFEVVYGDSALGEINAVWRRLKPQLQNELLDFIQHGLKFINSQFEDTEK